MSKGRIAVLICALAVMISAIVYIAVYSTRQDEAGDIYEDLQSSVTLPPVTDPVPETPVTPAPPVTEPPEEPTEPVEPDEPEEPYVSPIDFEPLWEVNPDVIGWLDIPDTVISYPVLQHPTDDAYYLEHTIEGKKTLPCSIFTELWNNKDFSSLVNIVYGHNMRDGSMFGSLKKFRSLDYMREHQVVSVYTPEGEFHYRIWAAVTYSNVYLPYAFDFTSHSGVQAFINAVKGVRDLNSYVDSEVEVDESDRLLVLSTCCPDNRYRLLVVGVLDEELSK